MSSRTLLVTIGLLAVTGCTTASSSAHITAAPGAKAPACATALAAAPETVADKGRTPLPVDGALSWGEPAIVLRCGLPAPVPTTKPCLSVNGIDWIVETDSGPFVFVSYGRSPAVELRVPAGYRREAAVAAVTDVGPVAAALPADGRACVGADDTAGESLSASPSGG